MKKDKTVRDENYLINYTHINCTNDSSILNINDKQRETEFEKILRRQEGNDGGRASCL